MKSNAKAISIIGGADGPTSVFLAGKIGDALGLGIFIFIIIVLIVAIYLYKKRK